MLSTSIGQSPVSWGQGQVKVVQRHTFVGGLRSTERWSSVI